MEYAIDVVFAENGFHLLDIPDVGLDEREIGLLPQPGEIPLLLCARIHRIEIIDRDDRMSALHESLAQMRADESSSARDQYLPH